MMQTPKRKEKKSESLDVRLPYSVKQNFMASARMRGETASEAVRRFIDSYVAETEAEMARSGPTYKEMTMTVIRNPLKTFGMAASAAAAAFAFAAMPSAATEQVFEKMDTNNDGVLTLGEISKDHDAEVIAVLDVDKSTTLTKNEFALQGEGIVVDRSNTKLTDDGQQRITIQKVSFRISEAGDHLTSGIADFETTVAPDATEEDIQALIEKIKIMELPGIPELPETPKN